MANTDIIKQVEQLLDNMREPGFILTRALVNEAKRLKAENEDLFYKLAGVMHAVDKWLDGEELNQDEVNRAATMREKTLQITEKQQAEIERLLQKLQQAQSEAIKKYDKKLWRECVRTMDIDSLWWLKDIRKQVLKEMVGDDNA